MKAKNSRCLILNADYSPISVVNWKRALIWSFNDKSDNISVEIIDFYKDDYICGVNNKKFPIPAVARTTKFFKMHNYPVNFSRKNIFIRDNYTCQYCGKKPDFRDLTYDHIIPKSYWKNNHQGSPTNWTNIVTCCSSCNNKKGNKTPSQAHMVLKNLPIVPFKSSKYLPLTHMLFKIGMSIPKEWTIYIPESYTNA
jgi:hypothetical protein